MDKSGLVNFVSKVEITDSKGNVIEKGGTLYVGEDSKIKLRFREKDVGGWRFDTTSGTPKPLEDSLLEKAVICSLVETAKANRLNVFQYLYTLLLYMPDYKDEPAWRQ